ncbi:hypothetical protein Ssi03_66330 [Sphaerisporangium siamense]|nr:hypothetical protein Ssi03_66330 [Sphaerisporangium siamense]
MVLFSTGIAAGLVLFLVTGAPVVANAARASGVWGGADLSVRLTAAPKVAQPGQWLSYVVKVRNAGPGDAVLPVLRVRMPDEVQITGVNVASCRPGRARNEVVCPSPVDIRAGGSGAVTILGVVRTGAKGPLRASAVLSSEVVDENEADNRAEATTQVDEGADLAVRLSPAHRTAPPGGRFTVRAAVRNKGPRRVPDARVYFTERGARFLSAKGGRCSARHGKVGCVLRPIGSGARGTLSLVFQVPRDGAGEVAATVYSARLGDRRPGNNQARMRVSLGRG